ncbi:MAG: flagellar motor switch protein FliG, partial [Yoonia sp.]
MNNAPPVFDTSTSTRRRKAAMVVQMLIGDGTALSLDQLPEQLLLILTRELGSLRRVDRDA